MLKVIRGPQTSRDKTETSIKRQCPQFWAKEQDFCTHTPHTSESEERKKEKRGRDPQFVFFSFLLCGKSTLPQIFFFVCVCVCVLHCVTVTVTVGCTTNLCVCVSVCLCVYVSLSLSLSGFHTHSSLLAAEHKSVFRRKASPGCLSMALDG